jgi:bifunctional non-homologous end joining protein LigD
MPADFRPSWHKRLKGEWHLVRMVVRAAEKRDNWLLIKSHDEYAN